MDSQMSNLQVSWQWCSDNKKTGPMPVSASPRATCPLSCPLMGKNGCYGEDYHLSMYWNRIDAGTSPSLVSWDQLCANVRSLPKGQIWRHNQIGDLPKMKINAHGGDPCPS